MLGNVRHTCSSRVMKKAAEGFVKSRMTEAMTVCCDPDDPSRGPSTRTRFDRFSAIKVLLLLGFYFLSIVGKTTFLGLDSHIVKTLL